MEQVRRERTREELHNSLLRKGGRALVAGDTGDGGSGKARCPKRACVMWFKKGACSKGGSCPYTHDPDMKGKGKQRSPSPKGRGKGQKGQGGSQTDTKEKQVCPFHLKGTCRKGETCDMKHNRPCLFWSKGQCKNGDKCEFPHREVDPPKKRTRGSSPKQRVATAT